MPAQPDYTRRYTVEEYFALEEASDIRHEYYHGEIFPLDGPDGPEAKAGGTKRHNRLVQNCVVALRLALRGKGCDIFSENVRLAINEADHYNYPDVVVTCSPADRQDPRIVRYPSVIVEVLSASTEAHDRGWKFQQYQALPSLQHYVLVSQRRRLIEWYSRSDSGTWILASVRELDEAVTLSALDISLPVADLYENVETGPEEGPVLLRLPD
ncbi:Uma2 family endonuclease [Hymenobacter weizhouensis]|uniref:Uma2 family endonuclease n=1 Tax=Hymenobacter sp. YIM 151500-1 TaxID=2987689 RepID=UPI00222738F9|nr:Uma2 family endonuclease [Hymenobacter sp. YIM 151500-1]UYZ64430.1 Uma2 family endonuclease [Hymenobacter sp. YIM 151500-1]